MLYSVMNCMLIEGHTSPYEAALTPRHAYQGIRNVYSVLKRTDIREAVCSDHFSFKDSSAFSHHLKLCLFLADCVQGESLCRA